MLLHGSLGCSAENDIPALARKYSGMGRIAFVHLRNVQILPDGSFEERAHLSRCGSLDLYEIVRALVETGFDGYVRPDHGRMIWGESGKPGYGLYDRALGAAYLNGLFEACEKARAGPVRDRRFFGKNALPSPRDAPRARLTGSPKNRGIFRELLRPRRPVRG